MHGIRKLLTQSPFPKILSQSHALSEPTLRYQIHNRSDSVSSHHTHPSHSISPHRRLPESPASFCRKTGPSKRTFHTGAALVYHIRMRSAPLTSKLLARDGSANVPHPPEVGDMQAVSLSPQQPSVNRVNHAVELSMAILFLLLMLFSALHTAVSIGFKSFCAFEHARRLAGMAVSHCISWYRSSLSTLVLCPRPCYSTGHW